MNNNVYQNPSHTIQTVGPGSYNALESYNYLHKDPCSANLKLNLKDKQGAGNYVYIG